MRLKHKLKQLLHAELARPVEKVKRDFAEAAKMRALVNEKMAEPLSAFCKRRANFDLKHGMVYKLLKTSPERLHNGVLATHDMSRWLRQGKVVPAVWIVRLAGAKHGVVARNQLLKWLVEHGSHSDSDMVLKWTKKWGIEADARALTTVARATNVADARAQYKKADLDAKARQVLGNKLLKAVASSQVPAEVFSFYKSLNKDVYTFQIILAAMVKNPGLRVYCETVWDTVERHSQANNIKVDEKLEQTHSAVLRLLNASSASEVPPARETAADQPPAAPSEKMAKPQP